MSGVNHDIVTVLNDFVYSLDYLQVDFLPILFQILTLAILKASELQDDLRPTSMTPARAFPSHQAATNMC